MNVLIAIVAMPAIGGWLLAAFSAIQIFLLLPKGQRFAGYNDLSMWRLARLQERIGPAAAPHINRMKQGGIAFALSLIVIFVLVAVSIPFQTQEPAVGTAVLDGPINGVSNA